MGPARTEAPLQSTLPEFSHDNLTSILHSSLCSHLHFTEEEVDPEKSRILPEATQLIRGAIELQSQAGGFLGLLLPLASSVSLKKIRISKCTFDLTSS